jgi:transcriptional regulator with XRE-family HTH domain
MARTYKKILNRLRKYRKLMGYSQMEVALKLGYSSTSQVSRWEEGLAMPSAINLLKLSIIYGRLPNDLYFDTYLELKSILIKKDK